MIRGHGKLVPIIRFKLAPLQFVGYKIYLQDAFDSADPQIHARPFCTDTGKPWRGLHRARDPARDTRRTGAHKQRYHDTRCRARVLAGP